MFGLVGVLAASSPNLSEAAQLLSRYQQLLATDCAWTIVLSKRYFDLEFILQGELPDAVVRYPIELSFASMLAGLRKLSGVKVWPIECAFSYSKPEYYKAYESCFGGSVNFGAKRNRMRFAAEVAGLSVLSALPSLRQVLEQSAHDSCKAMTEGKSWTSRVKTQIGFLLDSGHWASAQTLATRLGCSQRTLARHLLLEGSSLRQMLDEARLAKSKALLLNKAHSLEDIACSLGFSELRSFHRAFSRWSGMSPSRFRKLSGV
jgi:AraC-like DNA-binding protein